MEKTTVKRAISIVKSQTYDDSQFYQFVDVEGLRLPAKHFYSALFGVPYQDINTHKAERELKKLGYEIITTQSTIKLPTIWKVSHGPKFVNGSNKTWLLENKYITVHKDTGNGGATNFIDKIQVGDIVSLGYGNAVAKLVKVISGVVKDDDNPFESGWKLRKYVEIASLPKALPYEGIDKTWSPRRPNTCAAVPTHELQLFENEILNKYYKLNLKDLEDLYSSLSDTSFIDIKKMSNMDIISLNQILYGPPGTGKTFHTIEAAVKAAEPTFYLDLNIDQLKGATQEQRAQLQSKFKELSDSKRIRFVTFHQSYGYEEFVEGLKAECNDEGQISYCVEAGIFKQICQDAKSSNAEHQQFDSALEKLKELCSDEQNPLRVKTSNKSEFDVVYRGGKTFLLDPVSAGRSCGYSASLENIKKLYLTGNKDGIYNISYVRGLLEYMREHLNLAPISQHEKQIQPYVLVIDEINRGNISKIFGELITLIEPSKRKGAEEALEVTLPYSGDIFSVPDNLHIIGTMNTADRSLAMMDTALRRRFDFVEMMPKPELFKNRKIRNIDLTKLLTTLNNRIEVLYDREHTLGHAFLFPVYNEQDEGKAFELLKAAFKNKIIPLLEEYFFDDWNKIRLVLGDNQKEAALCFVTKQEDSYESLFGTNHGLNLYEDTKVTFQLASFDGDDSVWDRPEAYIAIYTKG
ncbi:TPA: McrB family protein [Photobacterium damselae]